MKMKFLSTTALVIGLALSPITDITALAHEGSKKMMQSSPNVDKAPYDVQFLDTMIQHHRGGIKMMKMAVDKAQSKGVKQMAEHMMNDQKKEIGELKSLRNQVKVDAPKAINMMLPGMMPMEKEMAELEASSGSHFDKHFLHTMIKHHQGAVKMSDDALVKSKNSEVKARAQMMHDKQKREIVEMKHMHDSMK